MNTSDGGILISVLQDEILTGTGANVPRNRLGFSVVNPRRDAPASFRNADGVDAATVKKRILQGEAAGASTICIYIHYAERDHEAVRPLVRDMSAAAAITASLGGDWEFSPFADYMLMDNTAWSFIVCRSERFTLGHLDSVSFVLRNLESRTSPGLAQVRVELMEIDGIPDSSHIFSLPRKPSVPSVLQFLPSPGTVRPGGAAILSSSVTCVDDAVIQPGGRAAGDPAEVIVTERQTRYELSGGGGALHAELYVYAAPPEIPLFAVDPDDPRFVVWATSCGESVMLDGKKAASAGTAPIGSDRAMTIRCSNALGTVEKTILVADRDHVRSFSRTLRQRGNSATVRVEWSVSGAETVEPFFADDSWRALPPGAEGSWEGIVTCKGTHNRARLDFIAGGTSLRVVL